MNPSLLGEHIADSRGARVFIETFQLEAKHANTAFELGHTPRERLRGGASRFYEQVVDRGAGELRDTADAVIETYSAEAFKFFLAQTEADHSALSVRSHLGFQRAKDPGTDDGREDNLRGDVLKEQLISRTDACGYEESVTPARLSGGTSRARSY